MWLNEFLNSYTCDVSEKRLNFVLEKYRQTMGVEITEIKFSQMEKWHFSTAGDIVHETGKFFRICGGVSKTPTGFFTYQPVIDQPEQGILGIISRVKNKTIELLLQAKIEPGNLDTVQYSPTVQATKSNYTGAHKGKSVAYIETFMPGSQKVMSRGYQSEHGYKFYKKANDNVYAHDNDAELLNEKFAWLTLADIRNLLSKEHCINMDTRSVIATMDFLGKSTTHEEIKQALNSNSLTQLELDFLLSALSDSFAKNSTKRIKEWVELSKQNKKLSQELISLEDLIENDPTWHLTSEKLSSHINENFELVAINAKIGSREVATWYQPIVKDNIPKTYAFLFKKINGTIHVLAQLVEESFSWSGPELGPTIHGIDTTKKNMNNVLQEFKVTSDDIEIIYDKYQSEEGGRFMEQKNRYMLIGVDKNVTIQKTEEYKWMTLYQLKQMTKYECSVNIEARTLLAIASFLKTQEL